MKECRKRPDPSFYQFIDQTIVKVEAGGVRPPSACRQHARPGNREPVCLDTQTAHQRDVLLIPMVMVTGHIARVTMLHLSGRMGKDVPDRWSASPFSDATLNLIAGGG